MRLADLGFTLPFYEQLYAVFERTWHRLPSTYAHVVEDRTVAASLRNGHLEVTLFESLGTAVYIRKTNSTTYRIFVPTGLFDRIYLLSLLFMSTEFQGVEAIYSFRDRRNIEPYIPYRLKAIFRPEEHSFLGSAQALIAEYCRGTLVPLFLQDALVASAFFLSLHELTHVVRSHFDIRQKLEQNTPLFRYTDDTLGMSQREILEGFEVNADQEAAKYTAIMISGLCETLKEAGEDWQSRLLNMGFGLAFTVSLFDYKSRSLDAPGDGFYPHPLVRWTIIVNSIAASLPSHLSQPFFIHAHAAGEASTRFINALAIREAKDDEKGADHFIPLAQLNADRNLLSESILYEQAVISSERGRRIVFLGRMMELLPFDSVGDMWRADPWARWMNLMSNLTLSNQG